MFDSHCSVCNHVSIDASQGFFFFCKEPAYTEKGKITCNLIAKRWETVAIHILSCFLPAVFRIYFSIVTVFWIEAQSQVTPTGQAKCQLCPHVNLVALGLGLFTGLCCSTGSLMFLGPSGVFLEQSWSPPCCHLVGSVSAKVCPQMLLPAGLQPAALPPPSLPRWPWPCWALLRLSGPLLALTSCIRVPSLKCSPADSIFRLCVGPLVSPLP